MSGTGSRLHRERRGEDGASGDGTARRLPLVALLTGEFISQLGNAFTLIALPWYVLATTGSPARTGLVFFLQMAPVPVTAFLGGGIIDRLGPRRVSVAADLVGGVSIALIPLLAVTVGLAFWQLLALTFAGAILDGPGFAARRGLVPEMATLARMPLERANAAASAIPSAANLVGVLTAGLMLSILDARDVLWIDAASFACSAALVMLLVPAVRGTESGQPLAGHYLADLRAGVSFLLGDRLLLPVLLTAAMALAIFSSLLTVVAPVYARVVLGSPVDLGIMAASFGAGSLLGSALYGAVGPRLPRWTTLAVSTACVGLPCWLLVSMPSVAVVAAVFTTVGLAFGPVVPIMDTIIVERTAVEMRGRIFGIRVALTNTLKPAGVLLIGIAIGTLGLRAALLLIGGVSLATSLLLVAGKAMGAARRGGSRQEFLAGQQPRAGVAVGYRAVRATIRQEFDDAG